MADNLFRGIPMKLPVIRGLIDRRILVNFRADPNVVQANLPAPFHPKIVSGVSIVGICLIRLKKLRPSFLPSWLGISSENAAHRVAVEWEQDGILQEGVYVRRRDSNSWLNAFGGGRLFPGVHHHARVEVDEIADHYSIDLRSDDNQTHVAVCAHRTDRLPLTSAFRSMEEASAFFQAGSVGFSPTSNPARFEGLELRCADWRTEPMIIDKLQSSYFEDETHFPKGSIEFDSALLMRHIEHEWHGYPDLLKTCRKGFPVSSSVTSGSVCADFRVRSRPEVLRTAGAGGS